MAIAGVVAGCAPAPTVPEPVFGCAVVDQTEMSAPPAPSGVLPPTLPPAVELDWGRESDAQPLAEQISPDGGLHLWAVGELVTTGLGSSSIDRIHVYAQHTTGEGPSEIFRSYVYGGLYGISISGVADGWPVGATLDPVPNGATSFGLNVTYGRFEHFGFEGATIFPPYRTFAYDVGC